MAIEENGTNRVSRTNTQQKQYQYEWEELLADPITFLILLLIKEALLKKEKKIPISDLINFFSDKLVYEVLEDYDDSENYADYIFHKLNYLDYDETDLTFFNTRNFICDTSQVPKSLVYKAIEIAQEEKKESQEDVAGHFSYILEQFFKIVQELNFSPKRVSGESFKLDHLMEVSRVYGKSIRLPTEICVYAADDIYLQIELVENKLADFDKALSKWFKEEAPSVDDINTFYEYLTTLKFVNGRVKVPFSALEEFKDTPFYLKYLEIKNKISVKNWGGGKLYWEIELTAPETLGLFIPSAAYIQPQKATTVSNITLFLDETKKTLQINEKVVSLNKSEHQFDLLKILLSEQPTDFDLDFSEIAQVIEKQFDSMSKSSQQKLKKRYSNAAYQLNKKVELEAKIKTLLKVKGSMLRFNPQYEINFT